MTARWPRWTPSYAPIVTTLGPCSVGGEMSPCMTCTVRNAREVVRARPTRPHPNANRRYSLIDGDPSTDDVLPVPRSPMHRPDLIAFGWSEHWSDAFADWLQTTEATEVVEPQVGRVVRHDGAGLIVAVDAGRPVRAMFGAAVTPRPVVGDWVVI